MSVQFLQVHCNGLRQLINLDCILNIQETFEGGCILFLRDGKGKTMTLCPDESYDTILRRFGVPEIRKTAEDKVYDAGI